MLTILRLDHNQLETLPAEIGELQLLEELSFSDNKLTEVPLPIFQKLGGSLKMLNMAENRVKHLP